MTHLKVGDLAPDFTTTNEDGKSITLSDYRGSDVVLFFYPKDNTPGCTKEACNIRDNYSEFTSKGIKVFGISPDSEKKHQNFISKYNFPFSLLADTEKEILQKYGVWGPKKFMGKSYTGVLRTTFIIDASGHIKSIINKVVTKDHTNQIMAQLAGTLSD